MNIAEVTEEKCRQLDKADFIELKGNFFKLHDFLRIH